MTSGLGPRRGRLRAPHTNGTALVEPPAEKLGALVALNRRLQGTTADGEAVLSLAETEPPAAERDRYDLQGRSLGEVSGQARRELVAEAVRWTSSYRDVESPTANAPIFLAGHQPQLFHPGVWFKNFALGKLSQACGAVAVNLLIDTDTFKQNTLQVPGGSATRPERQGVAMDGSGPPLPFEERRIVDRALFASFGTRVAEHLRPLVPDPLMGDYWPMAVEAAETTDRLGACLAQARHRLEGRWGLSTLELPESLVCGSEAFGWFAAHLLAQLPRFHRVYNEAVHRYRRENRIRSRAHPVPDLAVDGPWLEAPFWIWTAENPLRRRLFAKLASDRIELTDRQELELTLPLRPDGPADGAVGELARWERQGVKVRPRALVTTLWARLALGDLFIHGIGGAKYDRVTDDLISRFFGIEPPKFLVVSATLHLPVAPPQETEQDARRIRHRLRELTFHPERYVDRSAQETDGAASPGELIEAKRRLVAAEAENPGSRERFLEFRHINRALQPWVAQQRDRLLAERDRVAESLRIRSVLCWREYAFCLHPEKTLREFLRTASQERLNCV